VFEILFKKFSENSRIFQIFLFIILVRLENFLNVTLKQIEAQVTQTIYYKSKDREIVSISFSTIRANPKIVK